jgi:16S rRNA (cytidine1402-2'-O)-methyltransferase
MKGKLYLIPCPLGIWDEALETIPAQTLATIPLLTEYIVEDIRTARRYIKKVHPSADIDNTTFHVLNKHIKYDEILVYLNSAEQGNSIGLLSEAGCPAIADPGALIVEIAHEKNIQVIPLVGPSSIILSLMASGFNGQNFAFSGYLPIEKTERSKAIKMLEQNSAKYSQSQIFIETPFRNNQMFTEIISICREDTRVCIACELSTPQEFVQTKSVYKWRNLKIDLHKKNVVFIIMA